MIQIQLDDRDEIQKEMNQLTSEINRIGNTTEFNTQKLLNGRLVYRTSTVLSCKLIQHTGTDLAKLVIYCAVLQLDCNISWCSRLILVTTYW